MIGPARPIPFPPLHTRTCDSTTSDIWFLVTSLESGQTSSLPRYHCHPDTDQEFRHAPFVYLLIHLFDSAGPTRLAHETLAFLGMHVSCPPPGVVPGSFTQDPATVYRLLTIAGRFSSQQADVSHCPAESQPTSWSKSNPFGYLASDIDIWMPPTHWTVD